VVKEKLVFSCVIKIQFINIFKIKTPDFDVNRKLI